MHGVCDCARFVPCLPSCAWGDVAFSSEKWIGTSERPVSQLNTQPMASPVNASRRTSRTAAHHSGPERMASPYSVEDLHLLSFASLSWRSPLQTTSQARVSSLAMPPLEQLATCASVMNGMPVVLPLVANGFC